MSWNCIPFTSLQARAGGSLEITSLDTLQSELSKSKNIPERFYSKDNLMEFCQSFRFGMMLRHSGKITQKQPGLSQEQRRLKRNSSFAAGSRNCAKISAVQEQTTTKTESNWGWMENNLDYGERCDALSVRYSQWSHGWKTHRTLFEMDLSESSVTLPKWGMMRDGELYQRRMPALHTREKGFGLLPTPTKHNAKEGAYPAEYTRNTPTLATHAGGKINPEWTEWMMGFPHKWTDLEPSVTPNAHNQWRLHGVS